MYMERSDVTGQNVIVLVLENYLSGPYLDSRAEDVNNMKFQQHNSTQSHIRVYHDSKGICMADGEEVGIAFGNTKASSKLVLATDKGTLLEQHQMIMSNKIFEWETETYNEVVEMLRLEHAKGDTTKRDVSSGASIACSVARTSTSKDSCNDDDNSDQVSVVCKDGASSRGNQTYEPTCGSREIDTCVMQISTSPYEHHADNGNDICDNNFFPTSHEAMAVMTHCMTFKAETAKKKKSSSSRYQSVDVTIRHGVPDSTPKGNNHIMCSVLGHFCGGVKIKWKKWNKGDSNGIPMGGRSHGHLQGRGSQLRLHHWISAKSDVLRVVSSGRSTLNFQDTDVKRKALRESVARVAEPSEHDRSQLLDIYAGIRRVILPVDSALIDKNKRLPPRKKRNNSTHDKGIKPASKDKNVSKPRPAVPRKRKWDFLATTHSNSQDIFDHEEFNRRRVVGMSNFVTKEGILRSFVSVQQLYENGVSVNLHRDDVDDRVFVGPSLVEKKAPDGKVILDKEGNPQHERMLLGQRVCSKELDASCGINNNSHNSDIVNDRKMDTVNLKRLTKNTASVAWNLVAIMKNADARSQGKDDVTGDMCNLRPMIIRGLGGVFTTAGVNAPRTSADTTVRESPMHTLPSGQDLTGSNAQAWRKSLRIKQCVNVYFQGYYLGLYYVKRIVEEERTLDDVKKEVSQLNEALKYLHDVDSLTFPSHIDTDISDRANSHYHELLGMLGMSQYITLTPVEKSISKGMQREDWRLLDMTCQDVVKPTVHIRNDELNIETDFSSSSTLSGKQPLLNWASLISPP